MTDPEQTLPPAPRSFMGKLTAWAEANPTVIILAMTHLAAFFMGAVLL